MKFLGNEALYATGFVALAILLMGIIKNKKYPRKDKINVVQLAVYLITSVLPFIWYFALKNHSAIHARFTHRLFLIFIFAFWIVLAKMWGIDNLKKDKIRE